MPLQVSDLDFERATGLVAETCCFSGNDELRPNSFSSSYPDFPTLLQIRNNIHPTIRKLCPSRQPSRITLPSIVLIRFALCPHSTACLSSLSDLVILFQLRSSTVSQSLLTPSYQHRTGTDPDKVILVSQHPSPPCFVVHLSHPLSLTLDNDDEPTRTLSPFLHTSPSRLAFLDVPSDSLALLFPIDSNRHAKARQTRTTHLLSSLP